MKSMRWLSEEQLDGLRLDFGVKKVICDYKTRFQRIQLFDSVSHGRVLFLDEKVMLTEADEFVYHEMLSHIPLFEHTKPKKVLIIGGGDGGILRECLKHPSTKVTLCEIDGEVIAISKKYLKTICSDWKNPRAKIIVEDGFTFLKRTKDLFDVILVDSTDPIGEAAKLFGENFFLLAKKRMRAGGIICFQCESPFYFKEVIVDTNKIISRNFKYSKLFTAAIPTYPSGLWCFVIASQKKLNTKPKTNSRKKDFVRNLKYYNFEIHESAFALPNFFKKMLGKKT